MRLHYEDLGESQFESLVVAICKKLFGQGVQGFAPGKDGGRDGKFVGVAERFPSTRSPWNGITVIQAKHTIGYNLSFSDTDFYSEGSNSSIIAQEIPKLIKLKTENEINNYILFSNRKMSGIIEPIIRKAISAQVGLPYDCIYLVALHMIDDYLKEFQHLIPMLDLDPFETPLIVNPDDLAEVIEAIADQKCVIGKTVKEIPVERIAFEEKNVINLMSESYAKAQRKNYLKYTKEIKDFLEHPQNIKYLKSYEATVEEFQLKIISKRKDFQLFDNILEYLSELLFTRDSMLSRNRQLTRALLFYMYYYCDIGESQNA